MYMYTCVRQKAEQSSLPEAKEDNGFDNHELQHWVVGRQLVLERHVEHHQAVQCPHLGHVAEEKNVEVKPREGKGVGPVNPCRPTHEHYQRARRLHQDVLQKKTFSKVSALCIFPISEVTV